MSEPQRKKCFVREKCHESSKSGIWREVCKDLPVEHEYKGNWYCVLHFPNEEKHNITNFQDVLNARIARQQTDFRYLYFVGSLNLDDNHKFTNVVSFGNAVFLSPLTVQRSTFQEVVSFHNAVFRESSYFHEATFNSKVIFANTTFHNDVWFDSATFNYHVDFSGATFIEDVGFHAATIEEKSQLLFHWTSFQGEVVFREAKIKGYLYFEGAEYLQGDGGMLADKLKTLFEGEHSALNLWKLQCEKPERIVFHTVRLQPGWFVGVDPRKFIFTDCRWVNENEEKLDIEDELDIIQRDWQHRIPNPYILLTIACRNLASNYEENNRYEEASNFRRMAFEVEWLEKNKVVDSWLEDILNANETLKRTFGSTGSRSNLTAPLKFTLRLIYQFIFRFDWLHLFYRILSFYGESWRQAFIILFFIVTTSAVLFATPYSKFTGGKEGMEGTEAVSYSLRVAVLQRPEPQPDSNFAKTVVAFETILAPLQAALLALAIRRKFMR
ncbi:MAG TPA: pentapeptide repeat-containing protein [Pyrinomonadaceae bacterium]|jgi:hypothetical protein